MNTNGKVATEILVMLVVVVITSAIILLLIQSGIITVKAENEQVPLLNTEFIPMGRDGYLTIKDFKFCDFVDDNYNCIGEKNHFFLGSEIHFVFVVDSATYNGDIILVENYQIKDPQGGVLFDTKYGDNFNFEMSSTNNNELISFKDSFVVGSKLLAGKYTLELFVENPLLVKETTLVENFKMIEEVFE